MPAASNTVNAIASQLRPVAEIIQQFSAVSIFMVLAFGLAGIIIFIYGLYCLKSNSDDPRQYPLSKGILNLLAGSSLLIPASMYKIAEGTLLSSQSGGARSGLALNESMLTGAASQSPALLPTELWTIIYGFVFLVGLFSFLKGIFMMRLVGQQGSDGRVVGVMKIINHLVFGVIAMNIQTFGQILGNTFFI